jgi:hypothetical protein
MDVACFSEMLVHIYRLLGVIPQKTVIFIVTAVRTSNLTQYVIILIHDGYIQCDNIFMEIMYIEHKDKIILNRTYY